MLIDTTFIGDIICRKQQLAKFALKELLARTRVCMRARTMKTLLLKLTRLKHENSIARVKTMKKKRAKKT